MSMTAFGPTKLDDPTPRHGAVIYTTGSHGCWFGCVCGARGQVMRTGHGASLDWAEHVAQNPIITTPTTQEEV